ncbi:hypothetical protein [Bremerella alba]|uniref:Uncharacterized protein n=1 Tax=Bremerella alba TaxID=980252 RepID=A0A7V8V5X3_9BACT|nr:hypothetical protein [Bremerella alba]MBA2115572.1 hypothetical protein [Bremerella alba]
MNVPDGFPEDDTNPTIRIDPEITPVAITMGQITDRILKVGGCYVRVDQLTVIRGGEIMPILSSAELSGFLNHHVEFLWVDDKRSQYKPLSTSYGNTWLYHPGERERLPAIEQDVADNWKPSKKKSQERIDGIVALVMAVDLATRHVEYVSPYSERGMLFL